MGWEVPGPFVGKVPNAGLPPGAIQWQLLFSVHVLQRAHNTVLSCFYTSYT